MRTTTLPPAGPPWHRPFTPPAGSRPASPLATGDRCQILLDNSVRAPATENPSSPPERDRIRGQRRALRKRDSGTNGQCHQYVCPIGSVRTSVHNRRRARRLFLKDWQAIMWASQSIPHPLIPSRYSSEEQPIQCRSMKMGEPGASISSVRHTALSRRQYSCTPCGRVSDDRGGFQLHCARFPWH
jgi:hypothetical protein